MLGTVEAGRFLHPALYFGVELSYAFRVTSFSLSASYYYGFFFGYNRMEAPVERAVK